MTKPAQVPAADRAVSVKDNQPDPFEAHKLNIEGLYMEAKNWLDGEPIANEAQAEKVQTLLRMIQEAEKAADDSRVIEKKPLDEAIAAIQDRYNPLIAPIKNKKPGKCALAIEG